MNFQVKHEFDSFRFVCGITSLATNRTNEFCGRNDVRTCIRTNKVTEKNAIELKLIWLHNATLTERMEIGGKLRFSTEKKIVLCIFQSG